jgi:hypothetical protein
MTASARIIWLGLGAAPYLGLVAVDVWMHERARRVPGLERMIHYTAAVALLVFLAGAFSGRQRLAVAGLAIFIPLTVLDEVGFHRGIAPSERRIHLAAYAALTVFIAIWLWI